MFPRLAKFPRRIILTCVYMYCLLFIHRLNDVHEESKALKVAHLKTIHARAAQVEAGCASFPPSLTKLQQHANDAAKVSPNLAAHYTGLHLKAALKNIIYIKKHNISWCLVPKVASTSWAQALLALRGQLGNEYSDPPLQVVLREAFKMIDPTRVNQTINSSLKFLFVRHPFQRLVSAYRNKLEDSYTEQDGSYFYKNYGRSIVQKFRKSRKKITVATKLTPVGGKNQGDQNNDNEILDAENVMKTEEEEEYVEFKREPSFEEYVDYLINTDVESYDEHWKPIFLQCQVCDFHYDYIIKYENFKQEIDTFVEMLQETDRLPRRFILQWENRGGTDEKTTTEYLSQVSQHKVWLLYQKYRQDFLYFGYTMGNYTK
ncbi:carbohydrate sulfotransferase 11-like [Homarus americanus]|uniref:Carbohydrate sulfotransferase n=1 Tax=Homarus americanus TaxID=6706 RepID=A0A8J5NBQ8_HOMAM|nr:carbohydrate sulfotransferase 11-like [Homarus americanus]XP_042225252.1 carbohydrate sulfotransferase 11-like [Homarus americanus]KAG7177070.1 Carbohydrate sulfotransferase 11-like 1 [Homarus americanus]